MDNFDFIKNKLESENVTAPESLSEEAIKSKLSEGKGGNTVIPFKKKGGFKAALALVACFAVIAVSVSFITKNEKPPVASPSTDTQSINEIVSFESYEELESAIKKLEKESMRLYGNGLKTDMAATDTAEDGAANYTGSVQKSSSATAKESFASTNKQVDSVDEADIIKTDGKYIYYISDDENSPLTIYSADNGKTERLSSIKAGKDSFFSEMFLYGDKLIVIGTRSESKKLEDVTENDDGDDIIYEDSIYNGALLYNSYSFVYTYDISDKSAPKLVDKYEQSGYYNSSRMIGSCVYLISDYNRFYLGCKDGFVPCACGNDGELKQLDISDISAVKDAENACYALIGAIDVEGGDKAKATKAVLGVNEQVYCNDDNLYLTGTYTHGKSQWTRIVKYSLNKTELELTAGGDAKGSVNDQFSIDEYEGNLRIALTDYRWGDGKDKNYLYVMNGKLDIIGKTESFAKEEHIEAVRFMGDTAYVITYEQTDPLFIIDLSNPKKPEITGEVKIDGFSSSLTPVDENTMLGIGFATKEEEWGIVQDGLKLALFDISDKKNPKVLDEYEIRGSDSEAQYTHKAIAINSDKKYWAIPLSVYDDSKFDTGALVIRIKDKKLEVENYKLSDTTYEYSRRVTFIGNYLYVPASSGKGIDTFEVK